MRLESFAGDRGGAAAVMSNEGGASHIGPAKGERDRLVGGRAGNALAGGTMPR
jgi:hypothetical protein